MHALSTPDASHDVSHECTSARAKFCPLTYHDLQQPLPSPLSLPAVGLPFCDGAPVPPSPLVGYPYLPSPHLTHHPPSSSRTQPLTLAALVTAGAAALETAGAGAGAGAGGRGLGRPSESQSLKMESICARAAALPTFTVGMISRGWTNWTNRFSSE